MSEEKAASKKSGNNESDFQVFIRLYIPESKVIDNEKCCNLRGHEIRNKNEIVLHRKRSEETFYFDNIFNEIVEQKDIFQKIGKNIVKKAIHGTSSFLIAYGQSGSGKTHTIFGGKKDYGQIYLICEDLFEQLKDKKKLFQVAFSMVEIYDEKIRDLVKNSKVCLKLGSDSNDNFYIADSSVKYIVESYEEVCRLINAGRKNRITVETPFNKYSNRSHVIMNIYIKRREEEDGEPKPYSTICLADLAGHETDENSELYNAGINKSLIALGRCFRYKALDTSGQIQNVHVPYRDSVLTKLLKNGIEGSSITYLIANIVMLDEFLNHSLTTLTYAQLASQIKVSTAKTSDEKED